MRILLTGFMGAGKTTVGERLAGRLGLPFVDLDREIERAAGLAVAEIFATHGEAWFRSREREALAAALALPEVVVATGGGTLTFPENQAYAAARGAFVVWLDVPFPVIVARLGGVSRPDRPLFRAETEAFALYRERLAAYRRADLRLEITADATPEEIVARLLLRLPARQACVT
ncbi:MAG: shikimate kinase [Acidobacteria bacterium]|jgi:shikimate kinase|nr:shikimate kinase [Thermoanaerobaculia bacterium]NLN11916.1 shikimate kinase [Acidobacteriota bacterium]MBP7812205.1 shikimate kinase [Thermoanaerobaculia bacterium]HNU83162.1 shikimate kinase [Thermoanaerobaculia bacterium]HPA94828.1 shikimate kinase [Thermoanaerobaculia bacterium]